MQRNYPRIFSRADDQDKDGFKLENVGLKFSSFAVVTPNPEDTVRANTSRASDHDESPIELARFFQCLKVETKLDEKSKQLDFKSMLDKQVTQMKFKGNQIQFELNAHINSIFDRISSARDPPILCLILRLFKR